jgi:hypothetical protein
MAIAGGSVQEEVRRPVRRRAAIGASPRRLAITELEMTYATLARRAIASTIFSP